MKKENVFTHLAAAIIVTILTAFIYASVQQVHRSGANDPQLQISRDIGDKLNGKKGVIDKWFNGDSIDISRSLAVFTTLYNYNDEAVVTTGFLNGKKPSLPRGVFDFAKREGENVFTWQPESGVRIAVVLKPLQSPDYSFVAVGRSLFEVEKREKDLLTMTVISWLLCMGIIMLHWLVGYIITRTT
jgi:hypothetical protein